MIQAAETVQTTISDGSGDHRDRPLGNGGASCKVELNLVPVDTVKGSCGADHTSV